VVAIAPSLSLWCLCSRRVCDCELGFGAAAAAARKGGGAAAAGVWAGAAAAAALEGFLADPWLLRPPGAGEADAATVQVEVPPLEPDPEDGEDEARRAAAQRGAAAAEDLARRYESGAYGSPVSGSLHTLPPPPPVSLSLALPWMRLCCAFPGYSFRLWISSGLCEFAQISLVQECV
jgi:hypothetical protein